MKQQALKRKISPAAFQKQMVKLAGKFCSETSWPEPPPGDLVAIADALIEFVNGTQNIIYLILLRSVNGKEAVISPFSISIKSTEDLAGWQNAFSKIPTDAFKRIKALVCDGRNSFNFLAKSNGWVIQRCHFHLLARIAHNRSIRRFSRTNKQGKYIQKLALKVITSNDQGRINDALYKLAIILNKTTSRSFKTVLSGFIKHYEDYRTYLKYPEYNLPTTSNSAEHTVGLIRDLQYRARGFRSVKSFLLWIETLLKFTNKITCNGKIYIPN